MEKLTRYERRFDENISKIDLLRKMPKWFDLYNSKLWGGQIPKTSFEVKTLKNIVGLFTPKTNTILLSNFYELTEEQYLSVFIHEMIHAYQLYTNNNVAHDRFFNQELHRINKLVPFEVKPKESAYNVEYGQDFSKQLGVVLEKDKGGNSIITFNLDFFTKSYMKIRSVIKQHLSYGASILVMGISEHKNLQTYKTKRSLSRLEVYEISNEHFEIIYNSLDKIDNLLK